MRLITQTTLYFQEGKSDKVYEIDLCEGSEGEFVVNFRYGRRGTRLKEGTKTPFPEPREKAEAIFAKLVESKRKKGYAEEAEEPVETSPITNDDSQSPPVMSVGNAQQRAATKRRLEEIAAGRSSKSWPLSRVLWRAGELGLVDAAQTIQALSGKGSLEDYIVAWTLGKLRSEEGVPTLRKLLGQPELPVQRIATEALLQCLEGADKRALEDTLIERLPTNLRALLDESAESMVSWLQSHPKEIAAPKETLYHLYALAERYPAAREALYIYLKTVPLQAPWFRSIRHLFKASEFRLDAEIHGLLAKRFEQTPANFTAHWVRIGQKHVPVSKALAQPDSEHAYSKRTRDYFRRRILRNLRRAGDLGDTQTFITLATGILLTYDDSEDLKEPRISYQYDRERRQNIELHYDRYASATNLNFLLYKNGLRYEQAAPLRPWRCRPGHTPSGQWPGSELPEGREEAYPELWNEAPDALAHLLRESRCGAVHAFAAKVWHGNPSFNEQADVPTIIAFLAQPFAVTQDLGLELAKRTYNAKEPDIDLLTALLACDLEAARTLAIGWFNDSRRTLVDEAPLLASMILSRYEEVHRCLRDALSLSKSKSMQTVMGRVIAGLLDLSATDPYAETTASLARETLLSSANEQLRQLSHGVLGDLLEHPLGDVQQLGAQALALQSGAREDIPYSLWEAMLTSNYRPVRQIGMELFAELSDSALLERADILANFCLAQQADLREAARPIVDRLAKQSPEFAQDVVLQFYPIVLRKETYEGVHDDVYRLLEGPLGEHLHVIPSESCIRMMESRYAAGQQLGLLILKKYVGLSSLSMPVIAKLGGQDLLAGREHVWSFYREQVKRVQEEKVDALRLMDVDWEDSRQFAFEFFEREFSEDDWNPTLLVSICDSVRGDVADFGRRLITRYFHQEDGTDYLLKLSQHPTVEMQTFASNYLNRFASDDLERLQELEPYFITVLSQVNRGRVAKARILKFLDQEAQKSEPAALLVTRVLTRQSVTIAIQDKAACIRTLHRIGKQYPTIVTPLQPHETPIYQRA